MAELGELHIVTPLPENMGGTVLNEIIFRKDAVPFPIFGYMDSSLSVILRFNLPMVSVNDLTDHDPLNTTSYSISGVRVLNVEFVDVAKTKVRLYLNKAPAYYPSSFIVAVTAYNISDIVSVESIVARPQNLADKERNEQFVDIRVLQSGSKAGSIPVKGGDYQLSGTNETIRKLVNELFAVRRGEMLHDPEFGNRIRLKAMRSTGDLINQAADMRARVVAIPQVESASVRVTFDDNLPEVIRFRVKIRTVTGSDLEIDSAPVAG